VVIKISLSGDRGEGGNTGGRDRDENDKDDESEYTPRSGSVRMDIDDG